MRNETQTMRRPSVTAARAKIGKGRPGPAPRHDHDEQAAALYALRRPDGTPWTVRDVAAALGLNFKTVYRRLKRSGVLRPRRQAQKLGRRSPPVGAWWSRA